MKPRKLTSRQAFEDFASELFDDASFKRDPSNRAKYWYYDIAQTWQAWQAAIRFERAAGEGKEMSKRCGFCAVVIRDDEICCCRDAQSLAAMTFRSRSADELATLRARVAELEGMLETVRKMHLDMCDVAIERYRKLAAAEADAKLHRELVDQLRQWFSEGCRISAIRKEVPTMEIRSTGVSGHMLIENEDEIKKEKADAARYRWLRVSWARMQFVGKDIHDRVSRGNAIDEDAADEAIDAAMRGAASAAKEKANG